MNYEVLPKPVSPYANGFIELNRIPIQKAPGSLTMMPSKVLQAELYRKDAGIYKPMEQKVFQDKMYSQVQDSYAGKNLKEFKPLDKKGIDALIKAIDFSRN